MVDVTEKNEFGDRVDPDPRNPGTRFVKLSQCLNLSVLSFHRAMTQHAAVGFRQARTFASLRRRVTILADRARAHMQLVTEKDRLPFDNFW